MEIFRGLENIRQSLNNPAITIGNFDGVHRGHQALFDRVKEWAKRLGGKSVVMTFDPHPVEVLFPNKNLQFITSQERKLELISASGIDAAIVVPFSREFSRISARGFVEDLLVGRIGIKALVVGHDYRFGYSREGDIVLLKELGREFGFEVETLSGVRLDDTVVSSTVIRQLILKGEMKRANRLLGRCYEIDGIVEVGRQRGGRLLGFPTANIRMSSQAPPRTGVYIVEVEVNGTRYRGAANLGYNPTFGDTDLSLEVHIFDFSRNIYGESIKVWFLDRIRDERRFAGPQELADQIKLDVARAREFFADRKAE
ncbi:bifunctional riboflavin kinase/FAD synthetase [Syntrophobacter fumaroxidans]|uniref:Riboflavin biosynthesis protein n=1 Tax=Syntrophobacter fumaroxidans (strain DSM 10017 / MPOB) TaxID=335543 RepID=A0LN53_SYNFM|nr:bifunctional riboflavin kinase/FAD synthetase [Syntrophobacter fumaroxidans]ABK18855.1 riboflavin kinase / FMN adenylyltransferase [Syntrophobacter fumaroxidans MPOB]